MFDLVLIETSGLADPGPVAAMFWQDEALCGSLYLCGIVAVVDARNALANMRTDSSNEMVRQLLCADTILINKVDLLERPGGVCADNCHPLPAESSCTPSTSSEAVALCDVVSTMAQLNPAARLLTSSYAQIDDLQSLLFVHTVNRCGIEAASGTYRPANGSSGFGQVVPHLHSTITSLSLSVVACASEHRQAVFPSLRSVDLLCRDLLYHEGKESFSIVRMKAAVWVAAGSERSQEQEAALHQLQAICDLFDVKPMAGETVPRGCCRFLVLGRQLDAARIEQIILEHIS
jgi:G3E family GTPase